MTPHPPEVDVIRVVRVAFLRGEGVQSDPLRRVVRLYDLDGAMLAEADPWVGVADDAGPVVPEPPAVALPVAPPAAPPAARTVGRATKSREKTRSCPECGKEQASGAGLFAHRRFQHGGGASKPVARATVPTLNQNGSTDFAARAKAAADRAWREAHGEEVPA